MVLNVSVRIESHLNPFGKIVCSISVGVRELKKQLTIEFDSTDVAKQLFAIDVAGHPGAEARVPVAQLPVHAVQSMSHCVHGVHHKLNLSFLLIVGVTANFF